jgi:hypothetical protein
VISDFILDLSFTNKYDNQPRTEAAGTNDWSIVTSIGWTF